MLNLKPSNQYTILNDVPMRIWTGTCNGFQCQAFVHGIKTHHAAETDDLSNWTKSESPDVAGLEYVPYETAIAVTSPAPVAAE